MVLDDREVLPRQLHQALTGAERLVVLDALSFPYESLDDDEWDLPMALALPPGLSFDARRALLGPPVLSRLGCDDLVADGDAAGWGRWLADEFVLPRGQFLAGEKERPSSLTSWPGIRRDSAPGRPKPLSGPGPTRWSGRRALPAVRAPGPW